MVLSLATGLVAARQRAQFHPRIGPGASTSPGVYAGVMAGAVFRVRTHVRTSVPLCQGCTVIRSEHPFGLDVASSTVVLPVNAESGKKLRRNLVVPVSGWRAGQRGRPSSPGQPWGRRRLGLAGCRRANIGPLWRSVAGSNRGGQHRQPLAETRSIQSVQWMATSRMQVMWIQPKGGAP